MKNNAGVASDKDTLWVLLLVAIQDDQFETVRDSIVQKPEKDVDTILKEIRECDTSLMIKDSAHNKSMIRTSCWATTPSDGKQACYNHHDSENKCTWRIPKFPDSWKHAFGSKMFHLLLNWHNITTKNKISQLALDNSFATVTEPVDSSK